MKTFLWSLAFAIETLYFGCVYAQKPLKESNAVIDSLQKEFKKNKHDSLKCKTLIEIGNAYFKPNPDSALAYYSKCQIMAEAKGLKKQEALSLTNKGHIFRRLGSYNNAIENYLNALLIWEGLGNEKEMAICYSIIGKTHAIQGNNEQALLNYDRGLKISLELNDSSLMASIYGNIGAIHSYQGNYQEAINMLAKSLEISKKSGNDLQMSICYNYFGNVFYFQGNFEKSIKNYINSLHISEKLGNKKEMSNCYTNIGNIQAMQQNWGKAIAYFEKALAITREMDDKPGISACLNNLGNIYDSKGEPDKAIEYYLKSLEIAEKYGNKKQMANCYLNIGMVYSNESKFDPAIQFYTKTLNIVKELGDKNGMAMIYSNIASLHLYIADSTINILHDEKKYHLEKAVGFGQQSYKLALEIGAIPLQNESAVHLQKAYTKLGNYKEAIQFAEIGIATKDSIFKEEKTKALTEMETRYQTEKKQQEIEKQKLTIDKQEADISRKKAQRNLFIIGSGLLVLLVIFVFRSYLLKKKSNKIITEKNHLLSEANEEIRAQRDEIEAQRDEIEAQRDMVLEQKEHIEEIHGELTSSIRYASRIQSVMLPSADDLNEILGTHFLLFLPRDVVSGDFYYASRVKDWMVVCVADCTGHGVPGAFMSMLGISLLNEAVHNENISQANQVLDWMRDNIIHSMKQKGMEGEQKDGMDIAFCAINTKTLQMHFAGANNPCWIVRQNEENRNEPIFIELKADRMPLAIYRKLEPFTNQTFQLQRNDCIYLMSDGYEDQFGGPDGKKFMVKKLREIIIKNTFLPLDEQKNLLHNELIEWIGNHEQVDDVTILGIKI